MSDWRCFAGGWFILLRVRAAWGPFPAEQQGCLRKDLSQVTRISGRPAGRPSERRKSHPFGQRGETAPQWQNECGSCDRPWQRQGHLSRFTGYRDSRAVTGRVQGGGEKVAPDAETALEPTYMAWCQQEQGPVLISSCTRNPANLTCEHE